MCGEYLDSVERVFNRFANDSSCLYSTQFCDELLDFAATPAHEELTEPKTMSLKPVSAAASGTALGVGAAPPTAIGSRMLCS